MFSYLVIVRKTACTGEDFGAEEGSAGPGSVAVASLEFVEGREEMGEFAVFEGERERLVTGNKGCGGDAYETNGFEWCWSGEVLEW